MIMITEYDFNLASGANSWTRVDDIHPVNLYYGKDNQGRNAIEFSGQFVINRKIHSSVVIEITHYKNQDGGKSIVFSLQDNKLLALPESRRHPGAGALPAELSGERCLRPHCGGGL